MDIIFDRIVALTGANLSKLSGVVPFTEDAELRFRLTKDYKEKEPKKFLAAMAAVKASAADKEPNAVHKILAEYEVPIITTNIDGLHQKAGSKTVVELNGSIYDDNVVVTGEDFINIDNAFDIMEELTLFEDADSDNPDHTCFMIIGNTSDSQTVNELFTAAFFKGAYVKRIDDNIEEETRKFLEEHYYKSQD